MQPNTQENSAKSAQGSSSETLPYAVPDYLGLEGAPQKPKKSKIFFRLTLFLAPVALLAVAGALVYFYWQQNTPEALFYRALENNLKSQYVNKTYTLKTINQNANNGTVVDAKIDYSDTQNPYAQVTYAELRNEKKDPYVTIISRSSSASFGKLLLDTNSLELLDIRKGIWYEAPNNNENGLFAFRSIFDRWNALSAARSQGGIVITGNYSQASGIIEAIKQSGAYKLAKTEDSKYNDRHFTTYSVNVDPTKLFDVQSIITKQNGGSVPPKSSFMSPLNVMNNAQFMIDKQLNMVSKISYTAKSTSLTPSFSVTIDISYPDQPAIDEASGPVSFSSLFKDSGR